jgi:23S rRNA (uracil1939-C5)-methyltransferase
MQKNSSKTEEVKCNQLDSEGKGIVKFHGKKLSVENLLPGEEAVVEFTKYKTRIDGKVKLITKKSKQRVEPKCQLFGLCGGCQLQHMSYDLQLDFMKNQVTQLMKPFGHVDQIIGMDHPWDYRNKITSSYARHGKKIVSGFYKAYSHDIVPVEECYIQNPVADPILNTIKELVKKFKMQVYQEDRRQGLLRHVLIRTGYHSEETMVVFVLAQKVFPGKNKFIKELTKLHPEITTILMNYNDKKTSIVLGKMDQVLYGDGFIEDTLCGLRFKMSPQSFFQINPIQTEKLYQLAMEYADIKKDEIVLDTYSGIGTISLVAAQKAHKVYGVEINKSAVHNAITNAKLNKIKNTRFVHADATEAMVEMARDQFHIDVLFMDPPREGSTPAFLKAALKLKPKKIVYISCNPETQARDLLVLKNKYTVEKISAVDMFPHTTHVETVVKLLL